MSTYDATDRNAYIALGAVFGALAGIGIGMLTAPRSGRETRERIRERASQAKHKASEQIAQRREMAMHSLGQSIDKSKRVLRSVSERAQSGANEMAQQADRMAEASTTRRRRGTS